MCKNCEKIEMKGQKLTYIKKKDILGQKKKKKIGAELKNQKRIVLGQKL